MSQTHATEVLELETPHGLARAHVQPVEAARAALVLGHGAAGSVSAPDIAAVAGVARAAGLAVALVEQPYRVAGRRSPSPAHHLDAAWTAVVGRLRAGVLDGLPLVAGGRSAGARVACRTAAETGAIGVLCLAFPLHPPRRPGSGERPTRQPELDAVEVPVLVIQGERDPFGIPAAPPGGTLVLVRGDHGLKTDHAAIRAAARNWLDALLA